MSAARTVRLDVPRVALEPVAVARHDVLGLEAAVVGEALGQAEHHLGGVGDLAGRDVVDAAADHLGDDAVLLDDLLGGEELGRRAQRLAGGEAEQRAPEAVAEDVWCRGAGVTRAGPSRAARRTAPGR